MPQVDPWKQLRANGKRVVIYARYSSRFQHSIEDQVRVCREWAERHGYDVKIVFTDEAVTGKSSRRKGLKKLRKAIEADEVDIVVVFTTNRLYRKMYQSLQFVEEEIVEAGKRCVFVQSGIDTADSEAWRQRLQLNAMIDEFLVQAIGKHVNAAHEGLLLQRRVFGTVSFGYAGEEIEGQTTRLGRPARRLIVDPENSKWVRRIFEWLVKGGLSIRKIVQRLNQMNAPLPPRCRSGRWTRLAVRKILENPRYVGAWSYGRTKAVWLNKKGYQTQVPREQPLREVIVEELRIIDAVLWAEAQEKLAKLADNAGRNATDGERKTRPRILNGMLKCKKHDQRLYVGGPHGHYMVCKQCREASQPYLFSMLPRQLALKLLCQEVSKLLVGDDAFLNEVIETARQIIEQSQQPDPEQLQELQRQNEKLGRHIKFVLESPGETDDDFEENRRQLADLRSRRATVQKEIARFEQQASAVPELPSIDELRERVSSLSEILQSAASTNDEESQAEVMELLRQMTGGEIVVSQCGERKAQRGWLQLDVHVDAAQSILAGLGFNTDSAPTGLSIQVKEASLDEPKEQVALRMYREHIPVKDIATALGWHRNRVTKVLRKLYAAEGLELPDGRAARHQHGPPEDCVYVRRSEEAFAQWKEGQSLRSIGNTLGICDITAMHAVEYWCQQHGLPKPTVESRRQQWIEEVVAAAREGTPLVEIAQRLSKSTATIRNWIREWFSSLDETCPNLRRIATS